MKISWTPLYAHPLPEGHRFPMQKYDLIPEQLLKHGIVSPADIISPAPADPEIIRLAHTEQYISKLLNLQLSKAEERRTGFPQSALLVERERVIIQGTIECCLYALRQGAALNVAGGTHHACASHGEGFCLLNDIAISSQYLLQQQLVKKILVVDLDVHQGNGTAAILQHTPAVFTFSMHGAGNYPMHKEQSDLDIALADGTGDDEYLTILADVLPNLIANHKPDLIHFQSGVDVLATDKLGRLSLSPRGCAERDRLVVQLAHRNGIPLVCTMGGGYSADVQVVVDAHVSTFETVQSLFG
jgi:acetoin utilization deacetylase AcuC-like enzyme